MKNMGLSQLRLVINETAGVKPFNIEQIQARAVHAVDVWENAQFYGSLAEATADCSVVVGTTRRRGQHRKNISMDPRTLAAWLLEHPGPAAIVFGNERTGLEDPDLEICNMASHIPVSEDCPSLNLSHAVQIYTYELFLALQEQLPVKGEWHAMNQTEITELVESITETLENLGFYKNPNKADQAGFFKDFISRAGLTQSEGTYFKEIIKKTARLSYK